MIGFMMMRWILLAKKVRKQQDDDVAACESLQRSKKYGHGEDMFACTK